MAETASAASDGLHVKLFGAIDISVPQGAIQPILHCWEFTLNWGAQNPALFISMLVFLLLALGLVVRGRNEKAVQKQEYDRVLENSKIPELPLPPPEAKG